MSDAAGEAVSLPRSPPELERGDAKAGEQPCLKAAICCCCCPCLLGACAVHLCRNPEAGRHVDFHPCLNTVVDNHEVEILRGDWICECGHVYSPAVDGEGKDFRDLPAFWTCPTCNQNLAMNWRQSHLAAVVTPSWPDFATPRGEWPPGVMPFGVPSTPSTRFTPRSLLSSSTASTRFTPRCTYTSEPLTSSRSSLLSLLEDEDVSDTAETKAPAAMEAEAIVEEAHAALAKGAEAAGSEDDGDAVVTEETLDVAGFVEASAMQAAVETGSSTLGVEQEGPGSTKWSPRELPTSEVSSLHTSVAGGVRLRRIGLGSCGDASVTGPGFRAGGGSAGPWWTLTDPRFLCD